MLSPACAGKFTEFPTRSVNSNCVAIGVLSGCESWPNDWCSGSSGVRTHPGVTVPLVHLPAGARISTASPEPNKVRLALHRKLCEDLVQHASNGGPGRQGRRGHVFTSFRLSSSLAFRYAKAH